MPLLFIFEKKDMKRFFIVFSFFMFTFLLNGQVLITLKSGELLKVNIISSESGIMVYTLVDDSIKTEKTIPLDDIKEIQDLNKNKRHRET